MWERLFGLDAQLIFDAVITGVNILILFGVLTHFLWKPVTQFLKNRQEKIMEDIGFAREQKETAKNEKEKYEKKLQQAHQEAEEIQKIAKERVEKWEKEEMQKVKEKTEFLLAQAYENIKLERMKVEEQLRKQYVEEAAKMALQILKQNLSMEMQREMLQQSLNGMEAIQWKEK